MFFRIDFLILKICGCDLSITYSVWWRHPMELLQLSPVMVRWKGDMAYGWILLTGSDSWQSWFKLMDVVTRNCRIIPVNICCRNPKNRWEAFHVFFWLFLRLEKDCERLVFGFLIWRCTCKFWSRYFASFARTSLSRECFCCGAALQKNFLQGEFFSKQVQWCRVEGSIQDCPLWYHSPLKRHYLREVRLFVWELVFFFDF